MEIKDILEKCDHTLLRVDCTSEEIRRLCDQAIQYNCASVCIPPCHVAGAKRYVGDRMKICTVIGFPNGYNTSAVKAFEAADAVKNGADEVDMVINLSMVKDGCWDLVAKDIKAVADAVPETLLKVIIECCLLTEEEKIKMCEIVTACGAGTSRPPRAFPRAARPARTSSSCASTARALSRSRRPAASPPCRTRRTSSRSAPSVWAPAASSSSPWRWRTPRARRTRSIESIRGGKGII